MSDLAVQAKHGYRQIRRSRLIEPLTRVGLVCKGVVYVLIAILALMVAFGAGGATTDQKGVVAFIAAQSFGSVLLAVIAAGMFAYALWRFICAFSGSDGDGTDAEGLGARAAHFASGIAHAGIGVYALKLLLGASGRRSDTARSWTARLLDVPGGELLVGFAGLVLIASGVFQIKKGVRDEFKDDLRTRRMGSAERTWATTVGRWGHTARGLVFGLIGVFLVFAAWRHDASEARGLEGVLDTVAVQPYGPWLLGVLAAGLGCYGVYCIIEAKYRRIHH